MATKLKASKKSTSSKEVKKVRVVKLQTKFLPGKIIPATRTEMVEMVNKSKGKPFRAVVIGKDNKEHTVSGMRRKEQNNPLGYIKVWSTSTREDRLLNPQTLMALRFAKKNYALKA